MQRDFYSFRTVHTIAHIRADGKKKHLRKPSLNASAQTARPGRFRELGTSLGWILSINNSSPITTSRKNTIHTDDFLRKEFREFLRGEGLSRRLFLEPLFALIFFFFVLTTRVKWTLALIDIYARVFLRINYARLQSESAEIQSGGVLSVHGPVSMSFARLPCCRYRRNRRHPFTRSAEGRGRGVGTQNSHKSDFDHRIKKMETRTSFVDLVRGPPQVVAVKPLTRVDCPFLLFNRNERKIKNIYLTINKTDAYSSQDSNTILLFPAIIRA